MIVGATAEHLERAAALIRAGGVVAFPTETVYGLGADAFNARAVASVFEIKARPAFDPLIVHIEAEWLSSLVTVVPEGARALVRRFWPGPLTIVLPKSDRIPDIVTAGLPSVAVRVPAHPVAQALIRRSGRPVAAPSANPFGYVSPTTALHVAEQIGSRVAIILDGGPCPIGVESTVVSFVGGRPALLRPGGVTLEQIEQEIGAVEIRQDVGLPEAPGQLRRHYAPRTKLSVVGSLGEIPLAERARSALLLPNPVAGAAGFLHVELLADREDPAQAAANLFACLRRLDAGGYERIYALAVPEWGLGRAIMDRLRKGSA